MAKVTGPALSLGAKGTIGNALTYQKKGKGHAVYGYEKPGSRVPFILSESQKSQKEWFALRAALWSTLSPAEKKVYSDTAKQLGYVYTGFNYYVSKGWEGDDFFRGLRGYWSFNLASGCQAVDLSGYDNNGHLGPACPSDSPVFVEGQSSKFGKALLLDGVNDYVSCGDDPSLNLTSAITIELWIRPESAQEYCWDGDKGNYGVAGKVASVAGSANWSWQLRFGSADSCRLGFQFNEAGAGSKWITAKQDLVAGQWYHIVGTFDGTDIKFYLDSVKVDEDTLTAIQGYLNLLLIGSEGWANHFNGSVDEFRIYDRALSEPEIARHYQLWR